MNRKRHELAVSSPARRRRSLTAGYSPGGDQPLTPYAIIAGTYGAGVVAALLAFRLRGRRLPERQSFGDLMLIGVASHKLSRLMSKDKVTSFARAPFTEFQASSGQGEVEEKARGQGLQLAVGELVVCPYCLAQWVATAMAVGLVAAPRTTRLISAIFVAHTVSDFLQVAFLAAEKRQ